MFMDFNVTRTSHGLVPPSEPTPSDVLELSVIDRQPALRCLARTLHVFRHATPAPGQAPAHVIREALAKALVPYYPLAGRLKLASIGNPRLQIECSGEGIWFVEANVNCSLEELDYLQNAMSSIAYDTLHQLLPPSPATDDGLDPLVLVQITQFTCNGFVMGLTFCHTICDGLGAAQFMKAVGEMARGADNLSITPSWSRELIQSPSLEVYLKSFPTTLSLPQPPIPPFRLEHATIDISSDDINRQKQKFKDQTGGQNCSTFDVVAASFWRHRTRAVSDSLKEDEELRLLLLANCRNHLNQPLPRGFYGNCFFPITIKISCGMLTRASIVQVVKIIQEAKANLPMEFAKWINCGVQDGLDPFLPPMLYTTLFVSEWGRLGFNEVDYGWGSPVHFAPIQDTSIMPVGIVGSLPSPRAGIRLITWCVETAHLQSLANWPAGMEDDVN